MWIACSESVHFFTVTECIFFRLLSKITSTAQQMHYKALPIMCTIKLRESHKYKQFRMTHKKLSSLI